jgi:uncharacterized protein (UPF0332 family)
LESGFEALVQERFNRAEEAFQDAVYLLEKGSYSGATNRLYYAAYYAAKALLVIKQVESSKHSGIISLFQKEFVKTGYFDKKIARTLSRAFEKRQKSDYADYVVITKKEAFELKDDINKFIMQCKEVFNRLSM